MSWNHFKFHHISFGSPLSFSLILWLPKLLLSNIIWLKPYFQLQEWKYYLLLMWE